MKNKIELLSEYKKQLIELKKIANMQKMEEGNDKSNFMGKAKTKLNPLLGSSSKNLFPRDEKGYLSAILLGALVFTFEIAFLVLSYVMFKN